MNELAVRLVDAFRRDFSSADRSIRWTAAEEEHAVALDPLTIVVGRVDAKGINIDEVPFFGEWKTINGYRARNMEAVKNEWKMSPQSLTYGVLNPTTSAFTVRWAIKPIKQDGPILTAFEWFTFTKEEVEWWRSQLMSIANDIRARRKQGLGRPNITNCFKYGAKYACPLFADGCARLRFEPFVPEGMATRDSSHLEIENRLKIDIQHPDLVILDASRIDTWLECEHKYFRFWEGSGLTEDNENLTIGKDFHAGVATYIRSMIR